MARTQGNGSRGHHVFTLDVNLVNQSIERNVSNVNIFFYMDALQAGWDFHIKNAVQWSVNVNGQVWSGTQNDYNGSGQLMLLAVNIDIPHNADGTKSFTLSFNVTDGANQSYTPGNASGAVAMFLPTIPRTSNVSLDRSSIECNGSNNFTIRTNRASSSFTHDITYRFGNASGTIATGVGDSVTWTPPKSLLSQIPNAKSGTGTITCTTKSGSTTIGSSSVNFTLTVGSSSYPSLSGLTIAEQNSVVSSKAGSNVTIALLSTKKVSVSASAKDGASIKSVSINNNGKIVNLSGSGTYSGTISSVTSGKYVVTVTDSRGFSASQTVTQTFYNYTYPTITSTSFSRTTATGSAGTLKASGNYANMLSNTVTVKVTRTGLSEETESASPSSGSWSISRSYSDLTYTSSFTASIKVTDSFGQTAQINVTLAKSQPTLWIGKTIVKAITIIATSITTTNLTINGKSWLDRTYPVGSIYMSVNSTNPGTLFGGSWSELQGRFLLGRSSSHAAGSTGGEEKHTLTSSEIASHNHLVAANADGDKTLSSGNRIGMYSTHSDLKYSLRGSTAGASIGVTANSGGGQAHNNMPPYLAVYMWKRTA